MLTICSHCRLSICNIYLFPVLVLKAGFGFRLLQFLFIAFLKSILVSFVIIASRNNADPNKTLYHYENTPMQYTAIFHGIKNDNFQMKMCDVFLIFAQNSVRRF